MAGLTSHDIRIHCCGVEEKGHCFAVEYKNEVIFLDAGFNISKSYYKFLDLGKDATYADVSKTIGAPILDNVNLRNVKGYCLSHEHSDHVSGLPFIYNEVCTHTWSLTPVFSTKPTIEGVKHKFRSHHIPFDEEIFISVEDKSVIPKQYQVKRSPSAFFSLFKVKIGRNFKVMWIPTEHSTLNAYSLAVELPKKRLILYTGDFKLNLKENRPPLNIIRTLREKYKKILLICETIGVENDGVTGTEDLMTEKLEQSLTGVGARLILVAIRASEVPRIHSFEEAAIKLNRRIALVGESMRATYEAMRRSFPGILVGDYAMFRLSELKRVKKEDYSKYVFLADARMWHTYDTSFHKILRGAAPLRAEKWHKRECVGEKLLELDEKDLVIFSTTGPYERYMQRCQGHMRRHVRASGAMFYPDLHVSGHGSVGDYRIFINALKPDVLIPFHREKNKRGMLGKKVSFEGEFYNPNDGCTYTWK